MLSKSRILSTLGGFIFIFLGPWMFYTFIANSFFENQKTAVGKNLMRPDDQMDMILLTLGCLILAYAFSTLYSKWARGAHNFGQGFEFGAWLGVFTGLGDGLIMYATSNMMSLTGHIADGIWWIVWLGITGGVVSLIYRKTS